VRRFGRVIGKLLADLTVDFVSVIVEITANLVYLLFFNPLFELNMLKLNLITTQKVINYKQTEISS
jgi:hypothetical protein